MSVYLISGLILFFAIHLVPMFADTREKLRRNMGDAPYKATFSIIALVALALIIYGMSLRTFVHVYQPPTWGRHATMGLMVLAMILLVAAHVPTNIKRLTRHPMLWGITLWALGHLLSNGDLVSLVLFGSFLVFALIDMLSANRRGAEKARIKASFTNDLATVIIGVLAYLALAWAHPYFTGIAVMNIA